MSTTSFDLFDDATLSTMATISKMARNDNNLRAGYRLLSVFARCFAHKEISGNPKFGISTPTSAK